MESDPGSVLSVWDELREGALCASWSARQPRSLSSYERAGMGSAGVLAVWNVCELWCWSVPGSLSSVCCALARARGAVQWEQS